MTVKERHRETNIGERSLDRVLLGKGQPRKAHWGGSDDDTQKSTKKRSIIDEDESRLVLNDSMIYSEMILLT